MPTLTSPSSSSPPKDPERLEAERLALELSERAAQMRGDLLDFAAAAASMAALTDHELRTQIYLLRRQAESLESGESPTAGGLTAAQSQTLAILLARYRHYVSSRGAGAGQADRARGSPGHQAHQVSVASDVSGADDAELLEQLADAGITVAADGLVEIERITSLATELVGRTPELAIALFHHTSSALLDAIRAEGLRVGQQTNFFNTQQGVYLSTMRAGQPVSVYSARAARVHGGEPVTLRVRRRLSEIRPDPDDADLAWAQGRQYVTALVAPADVIWERPPPAANPAAAAPPAGAPSRKRRPR